ncbi:hypothetical protein ACP275_05G012700 [Erythranthe tilingii]
MSKNLWKFLLHLLVFLGALLIIVAATENNGGTRIKNIGTINHHHHHHHHHRRHHRHHHDVESRNYNMGRNHENTKHIISRASSKFDLNNTSKRKIPNGPDPIHNRRQTPGRQA